MFINKISKTNLKFRIFTLAGVLLLLQLVSSFVATYQAKGLLHHVDQLSDFHLPATQISMEADMFHDGLSAKVYQALYYQQIGDQKAFAPLLGETTEMATAFRDDLEKLEKLPISEKTRAHIESIKETVKSYGNGAQSIVEATAKSDAARAKSLKVRFDEDFDRLEASLAELGDMLVKEGQDSDDAGASIVQTIFIFALMSLLIGSVVAASVYWNTRKVFSHAAQEAWAVASQMQQLSEGVENHASQVKEASIEQAAAIQESVSALTEMGSMIAQTSQNVVLSRETSDNTRTHAESGKQTMEKLAHSLAAIQKSNSQLQELQRVIEEIHNKTAVINDIVFKTQLLSFNASIEAARAGQHGRGFAVVAEEVGSLAEMSGQASKEIGMLLESSQNKVKETLDMIQARVQDGNKVGQMAIRAFDEISEGVLQINTQVKAIGEATQQQEIGVQQTNTAMKEMDVTSQSNARASTDTLTSAGRMSLTTSSLNEVLGKLMSLIGEQAPQSSAGTSTSSKLQFVNPSKTLSKRSDNLDDLATHIVQKSRASKKVPSANDSSFKRAA